MVRRGDKRGSHVGVVISFAIFITFIIFLYSIAQPIFQEEQREESLMVYLEKTLIENASATLTMVTVNITNNIGGSCIQLDNFVNDFNIDNRIFVWNGEQISTPAGANSDDLKINRLDNNDEFFKIYYSEEFPYISPESGWGCQSLTEGTDYDLGVTKVEKYVFDSKVTDLFTDYSLWYEDFKSDLGIPRSFEFGFGIIYNNGTIRETESISISKNVYIEDIPIQYVNTKGQIESGFFRLKTW